MKHKLKLSSTGSTVSVPIDFCLICGSDKSTSRYTFDLEEPNAVAEFAKLAGDISVVAGYVLNKTKTFEAEFCRSCFARFRVVEKRNQLFHLAFVLTILMTVVAATLFSSYLSFESSLIALGLGICACIGIRVFRRFDQWSRSPKVRKFTKKKLVIRIPQRGTFDLER